MPATPPRGIVPAVITPFREDETIDYSVFQRHIEFLISSGVHGLFVLGGQGEFYALSEEERSVAARFSAQTVAGRLPLYANVGAVTTAETVRLAQKAEQDGVNTIVIITPYYLKPSADELVAHYSEVCASVHVPVLAYNVPDRTGVELTPAMLRRVATANGNFIGLKDSSGKLDLIPEWKRAGLHVFVGRDHLVLDGLRMGAVGAVAACANLIPRTFVDLYDAYQAGKLEEATRLQALVDPLRKAFSLGTFPVVIKEAMNLAGMNVGNARRPAGPMTEGARAKLAAVLDKLRAAGCLPSAEAFAHPDS
jgi:4-hydroxy-tetrahydrodipicolinate synthase